MEPVVNVFDGNVDYENIKRDLVNVEVDTVSGVPKQASKVKFNLTGRVVGTDCIRAVNLSNNGNFPTAQPFVSFTVVGDLLTINHVSGLQDGTKYRLSLEIIAE